jgi:hypothetical protein
METIPTSRFWWSTTGSRLTCRAAIVSSAFGRSSSGLTVKGLGLMVSRTLMSPANRPFRAAAMQMSRSVIIPIGRPSPSRTGSAPIW